MGLKDMLASQHGEKIRASMGANGPPATARPALDPPGTRSPGASKAEGLKALRSAALIPIDRLAPDPDQPRKTFADEEIDRLADSLRSRGMLQPIRARWDADLARWVIVAGERRFRAARRAGWNEVPCITVDFPMVAAEILVDQVIENCLREDLAPLEQANAFKTLMQINGWSARRLAEELHVSHQTVGRAVGLLELPPEVRDRVESGDLSPRAAAEIATLERPDDQLAVADLAVSGSLSRDQVADVVKAKKSGKPVPAKVARRVVKLADGNKVTIEGPSAAEGDEAVAETLARARKQVLKESQVRSRGQGPAESGAGEQAA